MVTKQMSEAAKKFLDENPDMPKGLLAALIFVTEQPVSDKTPEEAAQYTDLLADMKTRIRRDYYNNYVPTGSIRIRSYIFGIHPNMIDEAKVLVSQDIKEFANELTKAGFNNFEINPTQLENLGQGLKVEAMIDFRYENDKASGDAFYSFVGKIIRASKKRKRS